MATALTLYLNQFAASTTLATANPLVSAAGGTVVHTKTTLIGTVTGWGEIYSQGNASAFAGAGGIGLPSGHGWFLDDTTLDGQQIINGTWTWTIGLLTSTGTVTGTVSVRVFSYSGGAYTQVGGTAVSNSTSFTTTNTAVSPSISIPATNFAAGAKLYVDVWLHITVAGASGATISIGESSTSAKGGSGDQVVTPGYVPAPLLTLEVDGVGTLSGTMAANTALAGEWDGVGSFAASAWGQSTALAVTLAGSGTLICTMLAKLTMPGGASMAGIGSLAATFSASTPLGCTLAGAGSFVPAAWGQSTALSTTLAAQGQLISTLAANTALGSTMPGVGVYTAAMVPPYITRVGTTLYSPSPSGPVPWRFSGANALLAYSGTPPVALSNAVCDDLLLTALAMGLNVVRNHSLLISVGFPGAIMPANSPAGNYTFNDPAFAPIDYAVYRAGVLGLRLITCLVSGNTGAACGTYHTFCAWRGVADSAFYTNAGVIADVQAYIAHVMNHISPYTGVALGADPTFAMWELGSELGLNTITVPPTSWSTTMANYVKSLWPNVLVGQGSYELNPNDYTVANIDVLDAHRYPPTDAQVASDTAAAAACSPPKAYMLGEYGWESYLAGAATASADSSQHHSGTYAANITVTTPAGQSDLIQLTQAATVVSGTAYTVSFWAMATSPVTAQAGVTNSNTAMTPYAIPTIWKKFTLSTNCVPTATSATLQLNFGSYAANPWTGTIWLDDFSFAPTAGGTNVIANPGFETGSMSSWTFTVFAGKEDLSAIIPTIEANATVSGANFWWLVPHADTYGWQFIDDRSLNFPGVYSDQQTRMTKIRGMSLNLTGLSASTPYPPVAAPSSVWNSGKSVYWHGVPGGATYDVERSVTSATTGFTVVGAAQTDMTVPYVDSTQPTGSVWYRVRAYTYDGVAGPYSGATPVAALAVTLAGAGTFAPTMVPTVVLVSTLAGVGVFTPAAWLQSTALSTTLAGSGVLISTRGPSTLLAVTLVGTGTLAPTLYAAIGLSGTSMDGVGTLALSATQLSTALGVQLSGSGQITPGPWTLATALASSTLAGSGTFASTMVAGRPQTATLSGSGTFTPAAWGQSTALTVTMAGTGTLSGVMLAAMATALGVTLASSGQLAGTMSATTTLGSASMAGSGGCTATMAATTALVAATMAGSGTFAPGPWTLSSAPGATFSGSSALAAGTLAANTALTISSASVGTFAGTMRATTALVSGVMPGTGTFAGTLTAQGVLGVTLAGSGQLVATFAYACTLSSVSLDGVGGLTYTWSAAAWLVVRFPSVETLAAVLAIPVIGFLSATWVTRDGHASWVSRDLDDSWKTRR